MLYVYTNYSIIALIYCILLFIKIIKGTDIHINQMQHVVRL